MTLEIGNNFIEYKETETEDAVQKRQTETLFVNSHLRDYKNTKGRVTLSTNRALFMDKWMSVYEELDIEELEYISVDDFNQEPAHPHTISELEGVGAVESTDLPDFGFTFVL